VLESCGLGDLTALREALASHPVDVTTAHAGERLTAQAIKPLHTALCEGIRRFHRWVRADFAESKWERLLVRVPKPLAGLDRLRSPVRGTLCLWERLEEARPDVLFPQIAGDPPYSRAHFAEEFEQFETALDAHTDARFGLLLARVEWQMLEERAVAVMKAYGHAVKAPLGDGARLTASRARAREAHGRRASRPFCARTKACASPQAGRRRALTGEDACLPRPPAHADCIVPAESLSCPLRRRRRHAVSTRGR
jgi:hypothetical protein